MLLVILIPLKQYAKLVEVKYFSVLCLIRQYRQIQKPPKVSVLQYVLVNKYVKSRNTRLPTRLQCGYMIQNNMKYKKKKKKKTHVYGLLNSLVQNAVYSVTVRSKVESRVSVCSLFFNCWVLKSIIGSICLCFERTQCLYPVTFCRLRFVFFLPLVSWVA